MTREERHEVYERCIGCCKKIPRRGWLHTCGLCRWHMPIPSTEWFGLMGDDSFEEFE